MLPGARVPGPIASGATSGGGGGGGSVVIQQFIWRPGGVPSATVLTTWAAVDAAIAANFGSVLILTDDSIAPLVVPAAPHTDCLGRASFAPYNAGVGGADIQFADGAQISNPANFRNTTLRGAPTAIHFLHLDIPNVQCILEEGSSIVLEAGATTEAAHADVPGGQCQFVLLRGSTLVNQTGNPALSVVLIEPTTQLIFAVVACVQAPIIGGAYPANAFTGDATTSLIVLADASAPFVAQPNLVSAPFVVVPDVALGVAYDDALVAPPLGAADVQSAIDALKTAQWLWGFNLTWNNTLTVEMSAGSAYDSTDTVLITSNFPVTWSATAAGAGGVDVGATVADQIYYAYVIFGTVPGRDVITSLSPVAPALPAGFTHFRRIGFILTYTDASPALAVVNFTQTGDTRDRWTYIDQNAWILALGSVPAVLTTYAAGGTIPQTARRMRGRLRSENAIDATQQIVLGAGVSFTEPTNGVAVAWAIAFPPVGFRAEIQFDLPNYGQLVSLLATTATANVSNVTWQAFNEYL